MRSLGSNDQPIIISAFWDAALQPKQIGIAHAN
jgi:hypothetical protein